MCRWHQAQSTKHQTWAESIKITFVRDICKVIKLGWKKSILNFRNPRWQRCGEDNHHLKKTPVVGTVDYTLNLTQWCDMAVNKENTILGSVKRGTVFRIRKVKILLFLVLVKPYKEYSGCYILGRQLVSWGLARKQAIRMVKGLNKDHATERVVERAEHAGPGQEKSWRWCGSFLPAGIYKKGIQLDLLGPIGQK